MELARGCQTCRTRRIKCDRQKPICARCVKSQRPCVEAEVAKQELFTLHLENDHASGKKRRPRGPRSGLVPLRPDFDLETRACAYFLQNHFRVFEDVPDIASTWTECFHDWKAGGVRSEMVDGAFSSLALLVFARCQKNLLAAKEASISYQRLLKDVQSRIVQISCGNISQNESDEVLLAIYFMARYESVVQQDGDSTAPMESMKVWSHFDGVTAILRSWYDGWDRTTPSCIVKLARRTVVKSSLLRERQIPSWLKDGERFGEQGLALEFDRLIVRTIALRQECLQLDQRCDVGSPATPTFEWLGCEANNLDQDLQDWAQCLPSKWEYTKYKIEGVFSDELWSPVVLSCTRHGYAAVWTEYFSIKMLLMNARLKILDAACPRSTLESTSMRIQSRSECLACEAELNAASDSLASFIPFCLGRIRIHDILATTSNEATVESELSHGSLESYLANLIVWPLSIAASLQHLDMARREWFRSWLSRVSSSSCECLVAYAMSDYWAVL